MVKSVMLLLIGHQMYLDTFSSSVEYHFDFVLKDWMWFPSLSLAMGRFSLLGGQRNLPDWQMSPQVTWYLLLC